MKILIANPQQLISTIAMAILAFTTIFITLLGTFLAGAIPELFTEKIALIIGAFILLMPACIFLRFGKAGVALSKVEPVYNK
ncbi:hypothetical protein J18TS1_36360 [Oceanobacillus oncorhynchi subsp. incaldanensis]|uniref:hypothetical protein n=1 Tax=Oceanobacillus oncorhynchi TaxID=545501 RepID=UPI001B0BA25B|nr:hypothetical protein [Oceanobacillus oncorhynchi]GIO20536.1 hypothetical protein J18TS1_36360 [Oceanobacillus oncorhynchi subsp. incaldanensis]